MLDTVIPHSFANSDTVMLARLVNEVYIVTSLLKKFGIRYLARRAVSFFLSRA